jgi:predicted transcriptional regulator
MPRRTSPTLTPAELRVMQTLWRLGRAPAAAVVQALAGTEGSRDSTVRTILRILERKGFVRHERDGRAFIYSPAVAEGEAQRGAVRDLVARFFGNSPERLVLNLLKHQDVDPRELQRLRRLVDREDSE